MSGDERGSNREELASAELAPMVVRIARAARADAVVCATPHGDLARRLHAAASVPRVIAVSHDATTRAELHADGIEVVAMSTRVADQYRQARLAAGSVLAADALSEGDRVVCVVGRGTSLGGGDLVAVVELDETSRIRSIADLVTLTDGVSPSILESVLEVAGRIGHAAQRGRRIGALFAVGDSTKVLEGARQLVLNPLGGHDEETRRITNPAIHDSLVELAKLDGAFVLRGDGVIVTSGVHLASGGEDVDLPAGLGSRHLTAAAVTARTTAAAVVVSATDGAVRVFSGGRMVLHRHPDQPIT